MYSGQIASTGPRYCPSIEDKVVRFADKQSHHIFLEPEGLDTDEIYCNGISTSLPGDVQEQFIAMIPGLERAKILRYGYAVEYDMVWPTQIRATLETKKVAGLFLAGQINGTSVDTKKRPPRDSIAGINAAHYAACGVANFTLRRDQAYIGVLVDDLVTKPPTEPYRMFTSRARASCLHPHAPDNADERLTTIGKEIGLVDETRWRQFSARREAIESAATLLPTLRVEQIPGDEYLRRPEHTWESAATVYPALAAIPPSIGKLLEIHIKYAGYIERANPNRSSVSRRWKRSASRRNSTTRR